MTSTPTSISTCTLPCWVEKLQVKTMDGMVKLKVKPGTQNDTKVRLRGKGFPVYKQTGQFGDMIVSYHINIPTSLTEKQKDLFNQLRAAS